MPDILLGLDIGSRYIKAAFIRQGRKNAILGAGLIKTPEGSVTDGSIVYLEPIADGVRAFVGKSGVKPAGLAVSINSPDIVTRNFAFPALSDAEIAPAVSFEIVKFFPSIRETHEITHKTLSSDASSVSVLAALCPLELIKTYRELASLLGLPLRSANIRADAQAKAIGCLYSPREEAGLLINIGYRNSLVSVIDRGKLALSRYTMSGAAAYDNMAAEKAGTDRDGVEKARLGGDFSEIHIDPYDAENILDFCFSDINDQIRQTMELYGNDGANGKLSFVEVVGEGGAIPGIERYFAQSHNLEPRELVPASGMDSSLRLLAENGDPKLFLAAAGSGFCASGDGGAREMNFAPEADAGGRRSPLFGRMVVALSAVLLIAAASIAAGVYFIAESRGNYAEIGRIDAEIMRDVRAAEQIEAIERARAKLSALNAVLDAMDAKSAHVSGFLDEFTALAPESLFIVNFNVLDADNIVMSGRAKHYDSIPEYALSLRQTGKYESVRINAISAVQTVSDTASDDGVTMTITPY
jgi:type IV pilus assembly protein PilM